MPSIENKTARGTSGLNLVYGLNGMEIYQICER
jgi:hypothetical protein